MSLIKREPSPAQSEASRANSLLSTGPRTARGKAISSLNGFATRRHCVRETLKTNIKNEAASLLKTNDSNFESSRGEAANLLKKGVYIEMTCTQSHSDEVFGLHAEHNDPKSGFEPVDGNCEPRNVRARNPRICGSGRAVLARVAITSVGGRALVRHAASRSSLRREEPYEMH